MQIEENMLEDKLYQLSFYLAFSQHSFICVLKNYPLLLSFDHNKNNCFY